jgi:hypothetical protein
MSVRSNEAQTCDFIQLMFVINPVHAPSYQIHTPGGVHVVRTLRRKITHQQKIHEKKIANEIQPFVSNAYRPAVRFEANVSGLIVFGSVRFARIPLDGGECVRM